MSRITAVLEHVELANAPADTQLAIDDAPGNQIASSDDDTQAVMPTQALTLPSTQSDDTQPSRSPIPSVPLSWLDETDTQPDTLLHSQSLSSNTLLHTQPDTLLHSQSLSSNALHAADQSLSFNTLHAVVHAKGKAAKDVDNAAGDMIMRAKKEMAERDEKEFQTLMSSVDDAKPHAKPHSVQTTLSPFMKPGMHPELVSPKKKQRQSAQKKQEEEQDAQTPGLADPDDMPTKVDKPTQDEAPPKLRRSLQMDDLFSPQPKQQGDSTSGIKRRPPLCKPSTECIFEQAKRQCKETLAELGLSDEPAAITYPLQQMPLRMKGCFGASVARHVRNVSAPAIVRRALLAEPMPSGHLQQHARVKRVRAEKDTQLYM